MRNTTPGIRAGHAGSVTASADGRSKAPSHAPWSTPAGRASASRPMRRTVAAPTPSMPRTNPNNLTINLQPGVARDAIEAGPNSSPIDLQGVDLSSFDGGPALTSLPPLPASPASPRHNRDPSRSFFASIKPNKSPVKTQPDRNRSDSVRKGSDGEDAEERRLAASAMSRIYHLKKNPGSTPELSLVGSLEDVAANGSRGTDAIEGPSRKAQADRLGIERAQSDKGAPKEPKKPADYMKRSEVVDRPTIGYPTNLETTNKAVNIPLSNNPYNRHDLDQAAQAGDFDSTENIATESSEHKKRKKEKSAKGGKDRNRSADRGGSAVPSSEDPSLANQTHRDGSKFLVGVKASGKSAGKGFTSAWKGFNKIGRSGSSNEKEPAKQDGPLLVLNLTLAEQVRLTRICDRLSKCKDKTEFWMSKMSWRCIDFLNQHVEVEGLYRLSGSQVEVKALQRRFDQGDVNLLEEQDSAYVDPHVVTGVLKAWLRELPDRIMPAETWDGIAEKIVAIDPDYLADYESVKPTVAAVIRDELSLLPPQSYYLLFAMSCHLSLVHQCSELNKMSMHNLLICVRPALGLEPWFFQYLVANWRSCWQGCFTEKAALADEYKVLGTAPVGASTGNLALQAVDHSADDPNERAISSRGSSIRPVHHGAGRSSSEHRPATAENGKRPTTAERKTSHESRPFGQMPHENEHAAGSTTKTPAKTRMSNMQFLKAPAWNSQSVPQESLASDSPGSTVKAGHSFAAPAGNGKPVNDVLTSQKTPSLRQVNDQSAPAVYEPTGYDGAPKPQTPQRQHFAIQGRNRSELPPPPTGENGFQE